MASLQSLKSELTTDPISRGYAGMTDAQAASSLETKNRPLDRVVMTAAAIFECLVLSEYVALTTKRAQVDTVLALSGDINVAQGSRAREWLMDAYPPGTATRTAFASVAQEMISRSKELYGSDLVAAFGYATPTATVTAARALP